MDFLRPVFESGRIDFKGQSLASSLATMLLVCSGIAAFGVGYSMERLSLCFYTYVLGIAVTYMVVLLPWPFFRRNPMVWLARSSNGSKSTLVDSPNQSRKTLVEDVSDDSDDAH